MIPQLNSQEEKVETTLEVTLRLSSRGKRVHTGNILPEMKNYTLYKEICFVNQFYAKIQELSPSLLHLSMPTEASINITVMGVIAHEVLQSQGIQMFF